jgi:starch phosphorylase
MDEPESQTGDTMEPAPGREPEFKTRYDFKLTRELPQNIAALDELSMNFYWSWRPEMTRLFREIDTHLWKECEQNPRAVLNKVSSLRLAEIAADREFTERIDEFQRELSEYTDVVPRSFGKVSAERPAAYFCAEYGVHNSLPNYSGGLGILAGDHLKSASDLNVPLVAVGLLYRYGYFRQRVGHDGWQLERYVDIFESETAVEPVYEENGERLTVSIHIRGREVFAQAWRARVGRISLYLLDTNVEQNAEIDRLITGHLYGGDTETRIVQEKVLGIGGVRLLRKLGVEPSVYHLNEGHSAFLTLELAREFLEKEPERSFDDAREAVRSQCVFTTHTPVAAGNDVFSPQQLADIFDQSYFEKLHIERDDFLALGRVHPGDPEESFGMTPFALRMCRTANGVSEKHGEVSRGLWTDMFAGAKEAADVPIGFVTNGVHPSTWIAPAFSKLYDENFGTEWRSLTANAELWKMAVGRLPDAAIWQTHLDLKRLLIEFVREKTKAKFTGDHETINEHSDPQNLCSPDALTIGFARRVAAYKRWDLLVSDLDRILKLVDDPERPVQFVFAGKAHPQDRTAKTILQELMSIAGPSNWQNRAVFIEDYDQEIARYLVHGVDVWMNVPRRPHEASGTSGMKAAMNGVLNFSILDGWWIEGFDGTNGFAIGGLTDAETDEETDRIDAESLYDVLENQIVPAFYGRDENGIPADWVARMRASIATLTPLFSSDRMVMDYIGQIYNNE